MSYNRKFWNSNDTIEADDLNHIEASLADINNKFNDLTLSNIGQQIEEFNEKIDNLENIEQMSEYANIAQKAATDAEAALATIQENYTTLSGQVQALDDFVRIINTNVTEDEQAFRDFKRIITPVATVGPANPLTIDDALPLPIERMAVNIEPRQTVDGNVLKYPYAVSGRTEYSGITYDVNTDGTILTRGTATSAHRFDLYGTAWEGLLPLISGQTYTLSGTAQEGTSVLCILYRNGTNMETKTAGYQTPVTFTVPTDDGEYRARIALRVDMGVTVFDYLYAPMLALGVVEQPFEPYTGVCPISGWSEVQITHSAASTSESDVYNITFPTSAGTVYSGMLTITSGVGELVVDSALDVIDGTKALVNNGERPYGGIQVRYIPNEAKAPASSTDTQNEGLLSNNFNTSDPQPNDPLYVTGRTTNGYLYFNMPESVTTVEQAKAWFAENPTQILYRLANPITYRLLADQIELLRGQNVLSADCGSIESVTYPIDIKLYVDNKFAALQS